MEKISAGGVYLKLRKYLGAGLAGGLAGAVNGLFGAGGGMVLVPLLTLLTDLSEEEIFPSSVSIILPICVISLLVTFRADAIPWHQTILYLIGSTVGGILAGKFASRIPTLWLHRVLGVMILWGGIRYLC